MLQHITAITLALHPDRACIEASCSACELPPDVHVRCLAVVWPKLSRRVVLVDNLQHFVHKGAKWSSLRAAVQPMFHSKPLQAYATIINEAVDALVPNLQRAVASKQQIDIHRHLGRLTMQVIGAAAFG